MARTMAKVFSCSVLLLASFIVMVTVPIVASVTVSNTPNELTVQTASYSLRILHDGFEATLRCGDDVLLQSTAKGEALPNLGFTAGGRAATSHKAAVVSGVEGRCLAGI